MWVEGIVVKGTQEEYTLVTDYTLLSLVGIILVALVIISVVGISGIYCYKYEKLHIKSDTNLKTDLQNGKIEAEVSVDVDGDSQKSKRKH